MAIEKSQTVLSLILPSSKGLLAIERVGIYAQKDRERLIPRVASLDGRGCNFADIHHSAEFVHEARQTETVGKHLIYLRAAASLSCLHHVR